MAWWCEWLVLPGGVLLQLVVFLEDCWHHNLTVLLQHGDLAKRATSMGRVSVLAGMSTSLRVLHAAVLCRQSTSELLRLRDILEVIAASACSSISLLARRHVWLALPELLKFGGLLILTNALETTSFVEFASRWPLSCRPVGHSRVVRLVVRNTAMVDWSRDVLQMSPGAEGVA